MKKKPDVVEEPFNANAEPHRTIRLLSRDHPAKKCGGIVRAQNACRRVYFGPDARCAASGS